MTTDAVGTMACTNYSRTNLLRGWGRCGAEGMYERVRRVQVRLLCF